MNTELQLQTEAEISLKEEIVNTEIELAEEIIQQGESLNENYSLFNPCVNEAPTVLLRRPFGEKKTLVTPNNIELKRNPWQFLVQQPYIAKVLGPFKYIRADVRATIMCRATVQEYGWFGVTSLYGLDGDEISNEYNRLSIPRAVVGDIQQRTAVEYILPYADPNYFMKIEDLQSGITTSRPANLFIHLHKVYSTLAATTNLNFVIYYNFENIELAGIREEPVAEAQMMVTQTQALGKVVEAIVPTASIIAKGAYYAATLGNIVDRTEKTVSTLSKRSEQVSGIMANMPSMPDFSSYFGGSDSKAETPNEGEPLRMTPFGDLAASSFSANTALLGARRDPIAYSASAIGIDDPHDLKTIIQIPGYKEEHALTEAAPMFEWRAVPWNSSTQSSQVKDVGYMNYMARFFRLWRGSIDYSIRFFTSPLIAGRVRVTIAWGPIPDNNYGGNVWSHTMSIQGSHDFTFSVPYVYNQPFKRTVGSIADAPYVKVELMDGLSTAGVATPVIHCVVFQRAGDDFIFRGLRHPGGNELVAQAQAQIVNSLATTTFIANTSGINGLLIPYHLHEYRNNGHYWFDITIQRLNAGPTGSFTLIVQDQIEPKNVLVNLPVSIDTSLQPQQLEAFYVDANDEPLDQGLEFFINDWNLGSEPILVSIQTSFQEFIEPVTPIEVVIVGNTSPDPMLVTYTPTNSTPSQGTPVVVTGVQSNVPNWITFSQPAEAQCEVSSMFNEVCRVNDSALVHDLDDFQDVFSMQDLMNRYGERELSAANIANDIIYPTTAIQYANTSLFDLAAGLYRYWNGSIRFKIAVPQQNNFSRFSLEPGIFSGSSSVKDHIGDSAAMLYDNVWNVADIEVPWYAEVMAGEVYKSADPLPYEVPFRMKNPENINPEQLLVAAGADFQTFILIPPPPKDTLPFLTA